MCTVMKSKVRKSDLSLLCVFVGVFLLGSVVALGSQSRGRKMSTNLASLKLPSVTLESPEGVAILEKRSNGEWTLALRGLGLDGRQQQVQALKIDKGEDVEMVSRSFEDMRNWSLERLDELNKPGSANCGDIKVTFTGALSRSATLCSATASHKIYAAQLRARIATVNR